MRCWVDDGRLLGGLIGSSWLREAVVTELRGALDLYDSGTQEPLGLIRRLDSGASTE